MCHSKVDFFPDVCLCMNVSVTHTTNTQALYYCKCLHISAVFKRWAAERSWNSPYYNLEPSRRNPYNRTSAMSFAWLFLIFRI